MAAGSWYRDPTTNVKIYKVTSARFPTSSRNWGHDYSEGGDEVSLPYAGATRAVLLRQNGANGGPWWLVDFTPGVGVSNPRQLTGALAPWIDLTFAFSNNPATPYYGYVSNGASIHRFDIRTMAEAPGAGWPLTEANAMWMHQSENDALFTWMRGTNGPTIVGYEPATGTLKTYTNTNINEPRIDRAGRYIGASLNSNGMVMWDWLTNTIVWTLPGGSTGLPFAHIASLRDLWVGVDWTLAFPDEFYTVTPTPNSGVHVGGPGPGTQVHGNGNWIQHPANPGDQWAAFLWYGSLVPFPAGPAWLAPGGIILMTPAGQRRLLAHAYNTTAVYNYQSFAKFSPDGAYVLFTSDMNGSGRTDVFLAALPTGSTLPVLRSLSPDNLTVGAVSFVLTVNGASFAPGSIVQWNGANRATTFINGSQLKATILATDVATPGTAQVTVGNPAPDEVSNPLTFTIGSRSH